MQLEVRGRLFSGMGKGKYYIGHPEYQRRFEECLGYRPFPGTLNIKLEEDALIAKLKHLRTLGGVKVESFVREGESFSSLNCFNGMMDGQRVTLLFIEVTFYNESVAELISPAFLREKFGLKDGNIVSFTIEAPDPTPGKR
ncbi:MAG: CTP-dependent riboflavin kinase [Thaumarchaeota archaeon]|nr:CTP-dependent riboflavin kinase [Nitrososphaerota archaeon]